MPDIFAPVEDHPIPPTPKEAPVPKRTEVKTVEKHQAKKGAHTHLFATFCQHPLGIWFQNKDDDEEIVLFLRRHLITNVPWIFAALFLIFVPLTVIFLFSLSFDALPSPFSFIPPRYIFVMILFYYIIVFGYALINFMNWFFNISIVSTKRIVDIDFADAVYHNIATTTIDRVADVHYDQTGALRSLFNYGDVFVTTERNPIDFDFLAVPRPGEAVRIIGELLEGKPQND